MKEKRRVLSAFMLVMINISAICGIKNWPLNAELGFASLFFFLFAALFFLMPIALVSAELATGWPETGGIFVWVKEAFGHRLGFLSVWYLWMTNIPWYPTLLSFIAGAFAYIFYPELANNKYYTFAVSIPVFWLATFLNFKGMKTSGWISAVGVFLGSFLTGIFIIALGCIWIFLGKPMQIAPTWQNFIPDLSQLDQLALLTGVMLGLTGIEMSAIHAREVKHPGRDYPRAILISSFIILFLSVSGTMAIAAVIPQKAISLVSGSLDAYNYFLNAYNLKMLTPVIALLITISAYSQLNTWIAGPSKGLLAAARSGDLPPRLRSTNSHNMPVPLLILQGIVVTLISILFLVMPSLTSSYYMLIVLTSQFYLLMYIFMFAAAIRLRYTQPDAPRAYRIPGGKFGIWVVCSMGILSSLFAFFIGFIPPAQISVGSPLFYVLFLLIALIVSSFVPSIILLFQNRWNHKEITEMDR